MTGVLGAALAATATWLVARSPRRGAWRLRATRARQLPAGPAAHRVAARLQAARIGRRRNDEVVTLCAALAAELRAGQPPAAALAAAAGEVPIMGPRLQVAARAVGRGARLGDELTVVATEARCDRLRVVAAVCAAGEATGSGIADVLDRLGNGFASDDESRAELAALAAGPRATAVVLAGLPVAAVALGTALGLSPLHILFHTGLGVALWLAAALLELTGIVWVRRITDRALRG